jgi:aminoglycoside phosphotransferase (APT) family kinase protein
MRALDDVSKLTPHLFGRLEKLVRGYGPIVERMSAQPPTLVQGGCRSSNILIGIASDPERVCIIDWEEASFGPGLFDVAHLLDGIKPPLLDRLLEAYRHGAARYGMETPPLEEMKYLMECFRLHMAFNSLSRAVMKGYKESDVRKLLDYAEGIGHVVYAPGRAVTAREQRPEDGELRPAVARWISDALGHEVGIDGWRREPSPVAVAGVSPIETLRVSMAGEDELTLFVKHPGEDQAAHPDKQSRDREWRLYEDWFRADGLPVPRYYGSRRAAGEAGSERSQRRELYLEYLGDWSLKYQALDHWHEAAPQLARLHARFAERAAELQACDYLLRLDAAYFRAWADRAQAAAGRQSEALAGELSDVVASHGAVGELLERQPVTLVHNDLAPKNVLVDRAQSPTRICFVDWEMAGVGCGALDLVHLTHGLDPGSDRALRRAYAEALEGTGLLPSDPRELRQLLTGCELHETLYRIANSHLWRLPPERVAEWVAAARDLSRRFASESAS